MSPKVCGVATRIPIAMLREEDTITCGWPILGTRGERRWLGIAAEAALHRRRAGCRRRTCSSLRCYPPELIDVPSRGRRYPGAPDVLYSGAC